MVRFFTTLFSLTENGNRKLKMHIFCCSFIYNPLQRNAQSLDIKGRNPETLGQTRGSEQFLNGTSAHKRPFSAINMLLLV